MYINKANENLHFVVVFLALLFYTVVDLFSEYPLIDTRVIGVD